MNHHAINPVGLTRFLRAAMFTALLAGLVPVATANPPPPEWAGEDDTTSQRYIFTTDNPMAMAEEFDNEYGNPALQVTVDSETAPGFGSGWQDPDDDGVTREDSGGAWELGPNGDITVSVPFADELSEGFSYDVDFFVNIVYATGFYGPPSPGIESHTPDSETVSVQPGFDTAGPVSWDLMVWEGTLTDVQTNTLSFVADSTGEFGSLVDTYEVYTDFTLVPEPATYAAIFGGVAFLAVAAGRRWRRHGRGHGLVNRMD